VSDAVPSLDLACNVCHEFAVPFDPIGVAIMTEHLREQHPKEWEAAER
jgi:hypothetical protein